MGLYVHVEQGGLTDGNVVDEQHEKSEIEDDDLGVELLEIKTELQ